MALAITISSGSHILPNGDGRKRLDSKNGFPVLDDHLQSNVPGLFLPACARPKISVLLVALTAAVRTSAKLIGAALRG